MEGVDRKAAYRTREKKLTKLDDIIDVSIAYILTRTPKWSTLRTVGRSKALSMTIIIPFIGYIILFNNHIIAVLQLWPPMFGGPDAILSRLYFIYFGLSTLGFAQLTFSLACPPEIKVYEAEADYVLSEETIATRPSMRLWIDDIVADYMKNRNDDELIPVWDEARYPDTLEVFFDSVISETMAEARSKGHLRADDEDLDDPDDPRFFTGSGFVNVFNVASVIYRNQIAYESFISLFVRMSLTVKTDVLRLRYLALDRSQPSIRLFATISYVCGFGLLAIPGVDSLIRVLKQFFLG